MLQLYNILLHLTKNNLYERCSIVNTKVISFCRQMNFQKKKIIDDWVSVKVLSSNMNC